MMTTKPARIRVDTRYEIDLMPITSRASISSLMRMAPSSAVAPAPTTAASATPDTSGAADRTLIMAGKKPVNASNPMLPSDEKPWYDNQRRPRQADEADDRGRTADHRHGAGAHADLGDQPQRFLTVEVQRVADRTHCGDDEPCDVADAVEEPPRRAGESLGRRYAPRESRTQDLGRRHVSVPFRTARRSWSAP